MDEALLVVVANSALSKLASFHGDLSPQRTGVPLPAHESYLTMMEESLTRVRDLLIDADQNKQSTLLDDSQLEKLSNLVYAIDDLFDELATETRQKVMMNKSSLLQQVKSFISIPSHRLGDHIKDMSKMLDELVIMMHRDGLEKNVATSTVEIRPRGYCNKKSDLVVGRENDKHEIMERLSFVGKSYGTSVLSITGIAGVGKTTLAKLVYYDNWVSANYDIKFWVSLNGAFDFYDIVRCIINAVDDQSAWDLSSYDLDLENKLNEIIHDKKFFLVLDDCSEKHCAMVIPLRDMLQTGTDGNFILLTTQSRQLGALTWEPFQFNEFQLQGLSEDQSRSMFSALVFEENEIDEYPDLVDVGRLIVRKCNGNPLSVKILGGMLRNIRDDQAWRRIYVDVVKAVSGSSLLKHWRLPSLSASYSPSFMFPPLSLIIEAYARLPVDLKACFAYCCMDLKDTVVFPSHLTNFWRAQGMLQYPFGEAEDNGLTHFNELLARSFLQEPIFLFNKHAGCGEIHSMMHDFARELMRGQMVVVTSDGDRYIPQTAKHVIWCREIERRALKPIEHVRTFKLDRKIGHRSSYFLERVISCFKKLRVLDVRDSDVMDVPDSIGELKHLRLLNLSGNTFMELPETICELYNLETLNLDGCERLLELPEEIDKLVNLTYFSVTLNESYELHMRKFLLSSLQHLELFSCRDLKYLWDDKDHLPSLKKLLIFNCQRLVSFNSLKYLSLLEELVIHDCPLLDLEEGQDLFHLRRLRSVEITGIQKLALLHVYMLSPATLQYLMISDCQNLERLRGLQDLTSLEKLCIYNCPNLWIMPQELFFLSALKSLDIRQCPYLSEEFSRNRSHGWRLISFIPEIIVNGRLLQVQRGHKLTKASSSKTYTHHLPRSLSYFSLKRMFKQGRYSEVGRSEEDGPLVPILPSRWEILSLAFRAIIRLRTMAKEKHRIRKCSRWKLLSLALRAVLRMRTMTEEKSKEKHRMRKCSRWKLLSLALRAVLRMRTMAKEKLRIFSEDNLLEPKFIVRKCSRWQLLSLVLKATIRMKIMTREREIYRIKFLELLYGTEREMMLHCCLFDSNNEFEREKLVQLWIAAKFLKGEHMEDDAQQFFDSLLEKNYIFHSGVDMLTGLQMYKVNLKELNATLSLVPSIERFQMKVENSNVTANRSVDSWHISVACGNIDLTIVNTLKNFGQLRTLLFFNGSLINKVPYQLFSVLKSLTALDLSGSSITELPSSIGDVKDLCYLDLCRTRISRLPKSIVYLKNLQALRLKGCLHLCQLPKEMKQLVNLRHIDFDILGQLSSMPRGIGSLIKLQTLSAFIVDKKSCNIRELKHLNNLSGKFCISGLELVVDPEDAMEATLSDKNRLTQLELRWSDVVQIDDKGKQRSKEVAKSLKPNPCLAKVQIVCFPGLVLPGWIADPLYTNLVSITLFKCEFCQVLPPLGQLPNLRILDIIDVNSVEKIDDELCGVATGRAFPVLETLTIDGMLCLKEWMGLISGECPFLVKLSMKRCPELKAIHSFPHIRCLRQLEVTHCGKLTNLPEEMLSSPLETLKVEACPLLEKSLREGGKYFSKIKNVQNVWIDSEDTQSSADDDFSDDGNFILEEIQSIKADSAQDDTPTSEGTNIQEEIQLKKVDTIEDDFSSSEVTLNLKEIQRSDQIAVADDITLARVPITTSSDGIILQSPHLHRFSFSDLQSATDNFHPYSQLGVSSFGRVYIGYESNDGTTPDMGVIAVVKQFESQILSDVEWLRMVNHLGKLLNHPHLVKLIGYSLDDNNRLLVYEFLPRGSLEYNLFTRNSDFKPLPWRLRMKIALGAAKGLAFLHSEEIKVLHGDFKTSNVLLDSDYNAKVSDSRFAMDGPIGATHDITTYVKDDSNAYAAPENNLTGFTEKSDVYSFGVVLLEIICGRRAVDKALPSREQYLVSWAKPYLTNESEFEIILDNSMEGKYRFDNAFKVSILTSKCLSHDPLIRPTMHELVQQLELLERIESYDYKGKAIVE